MERPPQRVKQDTNRIAHTMFLSSKRTLKSINSIGPSNNIVFVTESYDFAAGIETRKGT